MDIIITILFYTGWVFILFGMLFFMLSSIGILRMPDIFTRLHAGTKASTLGAVLSIIGIGMIKPEWFFKLLIIAVFILITNPISSSVLARASYKNNSKFVNKSGIDMYKDESERQAEEMHLGEVD